MPLFFENFTPKSPEQIVLERIIFVAGFARGGTTWMRKICALHPEIDDIPSEVVFRPDDEITADAIRQRLFQAMEGKAFNGNWIVMKAPANALAFPKLHAASPESKFIFITRDPRDVFTSFKESEISWMGGKNKKIDFCLSKQQKHFEAFFRICGQSNVLEISYERLHQSFHDEFTRVSQFLGIDNSTNILSSMATGAAFFSMTGRDHTKQNKNSGARKGVTGEWAQVLTNDEVAWVRNNEFWASFIQAKGYTWKALTVRDLVYQMFDQRDTEVSLPVHIVIRDPLTPGAVKTLDETIAFLSGIRAPLVIALTARSKARSEEDPAAYAKYTKLCCNQVQFIDQFESDSTIPPDFPGINGDRPFIKVVRGILSVVAMESWLTLDRDKLLRSLRTEQPNLFIDAATNLDLPLCFAYRMN